MLPPRSASGWLKLTSSAPSHFPSSGAAGPGGMIAVVTGVLGGDHSPATLLPASGAPRTSTTQLYAVHASSGSGDFSSLPPVSRNETTSCIASGPAPAASGGTLPVSATG